MLRSFVKSICVAEHRQPVIQAVQAQATSYIGSASAGNQLYRQSSQAQPTSCTGSPGTGNQLYKQRKHRQPVIQAAQAQATQSQATSYTASAITDKR